MLIVVALNLLYMQRFKVTLVTEMLQGRCTKSSVACLRSQQQLQLAQSCLVIIVRCLEQQHFICRLNTMYDSEVLADAGRAFQAWAAGAGNARSPSESKPRISDTC